MAAETQDVFEKALREGHAIDLADRALQAFGAPLGTTETALPLAELAVLLKNEGFLETSVILLEAHCERHTRPDDAIVLTIWREELSGSAWTMARRDVSRSSCAVTHGLPQTLHSTQIWRHTWPQREDAIQRTLDAPAPLVARDLLIVADPTMKRYVGLDLRSGHLVWDSGIVAARLDYSSSPVYVRPWLVFVAPPSIKRQRLYDGPRHAEAVVSSDRIVPVPFASPIAWEETLVFPLARDICVFNVITDESTFIPVPLEGSGTLRSPVVCGGQAYLTTSGGDVLKLLDDLKLVKVAELGGDGARVFSPGAAVGNKLVFEVVDRRGRRQACAYDPAADIQYSLELGHEFCDPSHAHLNFPPVTCGQGRWLAFSDTEPRLYLLSQEANRLVAIPLDLESRQPVRLTQEFSTVVDSVLICKNANGFACIDLRSNHLRLDVFQPQAAEIFAQPVVYGNRITFVCGEGVICHDLH